jgi:hypothetical protein
MKSKFLLLMLLASLVSSAHALTIQFFVKVPGYSEAGWIEIVDGAPKAKPAKVNGKWVTDRVQRGETILIKFSDNNHGKRCNWDIDNIKLRVAGKPVGEGIILVPAEVTGEIPKDVNFDNFTIKLQSLIDKDHVTRRIPIGTR